VTQTFASAFLAGCGAGGPLTLEVSGPSGPAELRTFHVPSVLIGSDEQSNLRLQGDRVSRRHAYLQMIGGRVFCLDTGSRAGVSWPDGIRTRGWLAPGRPIRVGPYQIALVPAGDPGNGVEVAKVADPLEDRVEDLSRVPRVLVEISDEAGGKNRWRMTRLLGIVGRWTGAKVRLRDRSVSRFHCALVRTPGGVWVVDLLSRGGTHHNGRPIRWEAIRDGDRLRVGRFVLQFWYEGMAPPMHGEGVAPAPLEGLFPPGMPPVALPMIPGGSLPEGAEASLLLPVMDQFKVMHQNMFEQFQQTLLLLVRLFTTMHQDQVGLVRRELEAYQQATRELRSLQEELLRHGPPAVSTAQDLPRTGELPATGTAPPGSKGGGEATGAKAGGASPGREDPARARGEAPQEDEPKPDEQTAEVHAWLSKRIADLQQERQGRWQRILDFVMGK
jgi:pSer/pThr/pTyr-binding forkhead associated (FHA) protein